MTLLVLGGYGVFGGRLARLLLADGHDVLVAGRDLHDAAAFTRLHGGTPLQVDAGGDLTPVLSAAPAAVIDATGPFQDYREQRYRVARFCIDHGLHYLDLSDDADFTAGISALNEAAVTNGCVVLSGVSSVPAISAAAVRELSAGMSEILLIESAILPGNRTPRGRSVVRSILTQAGAPLMLWRGGKWRFHRGWSDAKMVMLAPDFRRPANLIGAPDLKLFPQAFAARSVFFRAGLELGVLHWGLALLSRFRGLLGNLGRLTSPLLWVSRSVERFGTARGGMTVDVVGLLAGKPLRRRWQLIAERGDGPFIPAVPARAAIRKLGNMKPGARPCINDLTIGEIEDAMSDLSVTTQSRDEMSPTLFQAVLQDRWDELPASVQRLHSVQDLESFSGRAKVTRGTSLIARLAAWFFRFPEAAADVALTMTKTRTMTGEIWERNFGGRIFRSYLTKSERPYHYYERFWRFSYEQELPVRNGCLFFPVRRGQFFGLPLPALLLPRSESREYDVDGVFHFDVGLYAPLNGGLIVRYQGWVEPDCRLAAEPRRQTASIDPYAVQSTNTSHSGSSAGAPDAKYPATMSASDSGASSSDACFSSAARHQ